MRKSLGDWTASGNPPQSAPRARDDGQAPRPTRGSRRHLAGNCCRSARWSSRVRTTGDLLRASSQRHGQSHSIRQIGDWRSGATARRFARPFSHRAICALGAQTPSPARAAGEKNAAVFSGTVPTCAGGCGAKGHSSSFVKASKVLRVLPSMVTHSVPRQSRNTQPSGVLNEKKFGRRNKFVRSKCFFSSASEYCPKNRTACSSLSTCRRVTRTSFFVFFSSKTL